MCGTTEILMKNVRKFGSKRSRLPRFQFNSTQRNKGAGAFLSGFTEHQLAKFVHLSNFATTELP